MVDANLVENNICQSLRTILSRVPIGADIQQFDGFRETLDSLEYFLPAVLAEVHPEWRKQEGLDGFLISIAEKRGDNEAELMGHCILITDQTTAPFLLRLQIDPAADQVAWLELKLGQRGTGAHGMDRRRYENPPSLRKIAAVKDGIDRIDWVYKVTFGERR